MTKRNKNADQNSRLFEKGYWQLSPRNSKLNPVTTTYMTRKAAVAHGAREFGLGEGFDMKDVGQFL